MKKLTLMSAVVIATVSSSLFALDGSDVWMRQNIFKMKKDVDAIMSQTPTPNTTMQEDRTMSYHVGNSSGSRIEALYFRGVGRDSWSGNCLADSSTLDWINTTTLHVCRSQRRHGSPRASMQSGGRQRDLNGNYWLAADYMAVDVPLGGYDGNAYYMKVRWEDGTVRVFRLPYPWGDVIIYKNQLRVYLGISGRGLFYKDWIAAE